MNRVIQTHLASKSIHYVIFYRYEYLTSQICYIVIVVVGVVVVKKRNSKGLDVKGSKFFIRQIVSIELFIYLSL